MSLGQKRPKIPNKANVRQDSKRFFNGEVTSASNTPSVPATTWRYTTGRDADNRMLCEPYALFEVPIL
jgi:hypothetical protein